jgi:uncharacterized membrane protein
LIREVRRQHIQQHDIYNSQRLVAQVTDAGTSRGIHTARLIKLMLDFSESVRYCLFHQSTTCRIAVIRTHTWWQLAGQSSERPYVAVFQCHAQAMRKLWGKHGIDELAKT